MRTADLILKIIELIHKESAIITLYDMVLDAIVDFKLKDKLFLFQNDHKRHLEIILDVLNNIDINLPGSVELKISDYKGGKKAIESSPEFRSQNQALKELVVKERELIVLYTKALEEDVDAKSAEILDENLQDEQKHIRLLENHF